jgi:hypothetical protein
MRKLLMLAVAIGILAVQGCDGPMGPQGPQGQDGGIITSSAFEIEVDFTSGDNYEITESYGFEVLPYDVTLVYILWETDGKEIWRLLPQSVFFDDAVLQYNFDFTDVDVRIFLEGNVDFGTLDASWLQDQVFRVVVVPADNVGRLDYSDYEGVTRMLKLEDSDFQKR